MKLNKTPDQWAEIIRSSNWTDSRREMVAEDLATLFAEVDRMTAQLAEREAECFKLAAGVCEYRSGDDHGNPLCLMVRKPIPPNMYPVVSRSHAAEDKSHDA